MLRNNVRGVTTKLVTDTMSYQFYFMPEKNILSYLNGNHHLLSNRCQGDILGKQQHSLHAVQERHPIHFIVRINKEITDPILKSRTKI